MVKPLPTEQQFLHTKIQLCHLAHHAAKNHAFVQTVCCLEALATDLAKWANQPLVCSTVKQLLMVKLLKLSVKPAFLTVHLVRSKLALAQMEC